MRYRDVKSRTHHNKVHKKTKPILLSIVLGAVVLDGMAVAVFQAMPATAIATANLINFNSNALGNRKTQKIFTDVDLSKLSDLQKKTVTFKDNNYVGSLNSITDYLGDTSGLFLQGYVAVPNVGIYEPIYYGTSNAVLANGAGTAKDGQVMGSGNYGLSAHNMGPYVNWKVPVPAVAGGYINPGKYFTPLQTQTPTYVYMTDGQNIYTYKEAKRIVTNVGNSAVLKDSYPYDSKSYEYPVRNSSDAKLGTYDSTSGLGLGNSNNVSQTVGTYKFASLVKDQDDKTVYTVKYKTNYAYANNLSPKNFELNVESAGMKLSGLKSTITKTSYDGNEMSVSFKLSGDVSDAASTIGSKLVLKQLQNLSFVTLTTCLVPADGSVSSQRIINTAELVKSTPFKESSKDIQRLFPDLMKTKSKLVSADNGVSSIDKVKLTWWQKIILFIGNSLLKQSQWLSKHI